MTRTGLEPVLPPWKGGVLTAWPTGQTPQVGLEPTTDRLTADSSTTELLWNNKMERVDGIEPTTSAWKAEVIPFNYTRMVYVIISFQWCGWEDLNLHGI